jgi:hypothetical protein
LGQEAAEDVAGDCVGSAALSSQAAKQANHFAMGYSPVNLPEAKASESMSLAEAIQAQAKWLAAPTIIQRERLGAPSAKGRRYAAAFKAIESWARKTPRTHAEIAEKVGGSLGRNPDYTTINRWTKKNRITVRAATRSKHQVIDDDLIAKLSAIESPAEKVALVREVTGDKTFTLTRVRDILKSRAAYAKRKLAKMAQ